MWRELLCMALIGGVSAVSAEAPRLKTRWAEKVDPAAPLPEYPRPTLVRKEWLNLNGPWQFAVSDRSATAPPTFGRTILVPFPVESQLGGVGLTPTENQRVWYRRTVAVPAAWRGRRVLLHFGASDWETRVWVNGELVGEHRGGYDGFSFDVTDALRRREGEAEILVSVWDPTDSGPQARGKQVRKPEGIFYTPVTGIWQTVWMEPVPERSIGGYRAVPDVDRSRLELTVSLRGPGDGLSVRAEALDGRRVVSRSEAPAGQTMLLRLEAPKLWSPDRPFLYGLRLTLLRGGQTLDRTEGYFGMRKVEVGKGPDGKTRILLNGKPLFLFGFLDQGYWPDGLYTAPTEEALRFDIEATKRLGMNLARKHVKVEPERWYFLCDKLGLAVYQDMPSGFGARPMPREDQEQFERELRRMVEGRFNHPSILMWVVFNEGWGQYDTERLTSFAKSLDPSRLVNNASGWTDHGVGDVVDIHVYPGPQSPRPEAARAAVLGEFGGLGLPVQGHLWQDRGNWGYQSFQDRETLTERVVELLRRLHPLIAEPGLSSAVYTQTTDVEIEANGFYTYDREVLKVDGERVRRAILALYGPPPSVQTVVPDSQAEGLEWRYTTLEPQGSWTDPRFDDSAWSVGKAGFGTVGTPGAAVRTVWSSQTLWIRRTFELPETVRFSQPALRIHHDEDCEVFLDGKPLASLQGYTVGYTLVRLERRLLPSLRKGRHTLAVRVRNTTGGQYIDVGIVDLVPAPKGGNAQR
ncbi:MAG: hypothetical protein N2109_07850 [Fimbriimonadales bacterium]|nr:hypothetical protein [Fimbriimonadales bacterium]